MGAVKFKAGHIDQLTTRVHEFFLNLIEVIL